LFSATPGENCSYCIAGVMARWNSSKCLDSQGARLMWSPGFTIRSKSAHIVNTLAQGGV
jgi:hypothetical protein